MTPTEARALYDEIWEHPGEDAYDSADLTDDVQRMLAATSLREAAKVIQWWSCWDDDDQMYRDVQRLRVLAGVSDGDVVELLEANGGDLCLSAAREIRRLRGGGA